MEDFPVWSPFHGMAISSHEPLHSLKGSRQTCPNCCKRMKYFCYRCVRPLLLDTDRLPVLPSLPLHVHIIKHAQELDSKSTAIHAKLLSPDNVTIYQFAKSSFAHDRFEDEQELRAKIEADPDSFVLLYPDESSVQFQDYVDCESSLPCVRPVIKRIRNVIVIDGTWSQAAAINRTAPYSIIPHVKIDPSVKTSFWRFQSLGDHCLSTIEAIYYCLKEYSAASLDDSGSLDNLLYFYSFFYHLIQNSYTHENPDRPYTSRHRSDYIKSRALR